MTNIDANGFYQPHTLSNGSSSGLAIRGQYIPYGWPLYATLPPSTHRFPTGDDVSVPSCEKSVDQRNLVDVYKCEVASSHIVFVVQKIFCNIEKRLDRPQSI